GWDRPARIIIVATRRATRPGSGYAAVAAQIEPLRSRARRRPALRAEPVVGDVGRTVLDPGARRISDRRLVHDPGFLALEPMVEPFEIGVARPEASGIDKRVLVGADPQLLSAGAGLDVVERCHNTRLEDVEPGGDVKSGDVDGAAEIVRRTERIGCRMSDDLVEEGLPGGKIRVAGQRQAQPIRGPEEWGLGEGRGGAPRVGGRAPRSGS